jgi:hypothetical protein
MTVALSLLGGAGAQFLDDNGNPLAGGKLFSYLAGTTTPEATYTTSAGNVAHTNPIILDAAGRVPSGEIWLTNGVLYKFVLNTSANVLIATYDNISGNGGGLVTQLAAPSGSSLVGFIQSGTNAVARTVQSKLRDMVSVADFIPPGTDTETVDCQPFIKAAIAEVIARGGDTLFFPAGTYNLVTTESDGTVSAHFTLKDVQGIDFLGYGAVLKSAYSSTSFAAYLFNLNGCRRINFEGFDIEGIFSRTLSTVSQYSIAAFFLRSVDRDSESISFRNLRLQNVYTVLGVLGDPVSARRVRTVLIENVFATNGYYGLNFQENGDNVTAINFRTNQFVRSYFPYGVANHNINYTSTNGDVFTDCLIKAYVRDTINITVNALIIGNTSNDSHVTIESQHNPTTQPIPASLRNIVLNINDLQSSGSGPSLRFAYFQDTPSPVETPTSANNLFNNVTVRGNVRSFLQFAVAQPANTGAINLSGFVYLLAGSGDPYDFGFYEPVSRYTKGDSLYSFSVRGNRGFASFGTAYFGLFDGINVPGNINGVNGQNAFEFEANPNYSYRLRYATGYAAGTNVFQLPGTAGFGYGMNLYHSTISTAPNAANAVMKIGTMDTSDRSINATGTLNASGSDYAEYEYNNGLVISKGTIVGFKADGTLTLTFAEAVRFGVKSTAPSFVGGDAWASDSVVGIEPQRPSRKAPVTKKGMDEDGRHVDIVIEEGDTDEKWVVKLAAYDIEVVEYQAKIEVERAKVDRIAYSGKVPVNVMGATPGGYVIAIEVENGLIDGQFVQNPTFEEYKLAVGRVNRILDDGRAEIAIIIH